MRFDVAVHLLLYQRRFPPELFVFMDKILCGECEDFIAFHDVMADKNHKNKCANEQMQNAKREECAPCNQAPHRAPAT